jgi:aryl-alcohol dehydrogenase-like predicted oxidoreductase
MGPDTTFEGDDLRQSDPKFQAPRFAQYLSAVQALQGFARDRFGSDVLHLAVRWLLDQGADIALWGARRPDQVASVHRVTDLKLTPQDREEIDRILDTHVTDPVGPEFMAPPARSGH